MSTMTIGFIGLGNMGGPMAANLARAGHRVVVRDVDARRQHAFVEEHGAVDGTDANSFKAVDAVVTMLPNGAIVRAALLDSGIADVLRPDTLVLDTSSSDPNDTLRLEPELASRQLLFADGPVSGGMVRALDGTLSIMLGASDEKTAARAVDLLRAVSARIFRTGGLGSGHATKALNNYVLGAGFIAAAEAFVVGEKFGLDPSVLLSVINASSGRNVSTETTLVEEVLSRRYAANFTFALFSKDLGIADSLARSLGVDAPFAAAAHRALAEAGETVGWQSDYTLAVPLWEKRAGIVPTQESE